MGKRSKKRIYEIDYTLFDVVVNEMPGEGAVQAQQVQTEKGYNHPRLIVIIDPYTRLVVAAKLSYEGEVTDQ